MGTQFNHILVVVEPTEHQSTALLKAYSLALKQINQKSDNVTITVLSAIYNFSFELSTLLSVEEKEIMHQGFIDEKQQIISKLINGLPQHPNINIESVVVWHRKLDEAIMQQLTQSSYDLLVKEVDTEALANRLLSIPNDWHILRKSPIPVLLVHQQQWKKNGKILIAVNVSEDEEYYTPLNQRMITIGKNLVATLDADNIHLVTAYPITPTNLTVETVDFNPNIYTESLKNKLLINMKSLRQQVHLPESNIHVEEGFPEQVIPSVAQKLSAELVILGSIGRTGLMARILGNTAEDVLTQLNCDVLILK